MHEDEVRRLGPAWYRRVRGIHVLRVQGSLREMGRQHGALLRRWVPRGPLPYYRTYVGLMLRNMGLGALAPLLATAIERGVGRRVARALPADARDALAGMADGAGIDLPRLLQGAVMPDSLMWLATTLMRLRGLRRATAHRAALGLGCSSAVAWGEATEGGALLHARNMDYHGVEVWPRAGLVTFHAPDKGLRYLSVGAVGIPLAGFTAINEAGLALAVHQHMFAAATTLGGTPVGVIGDRIMRHARSLAEAEAMLREHRPIGCWTYLLSDGPGRRVLCYEETAAGRAAIYPDPSAGSFAYSNIYLDPSLGRTELDLYPSYWRNNLGRVQRVRELLAPEGWPLSPDGMAAIMGDPGDRSCRLRVAISMLLTVASVVMRPEDGTVWVARGEVPVSENAYVPFDLGAEDHAPERGELTGGEPRDRAAAAAFLLYREAYLACFERGELDRARLLMQDALALRPDEPLYHVLAGLLALKQGHAALAEARLTRCLELGHPDPERICTFHLWRGRARDLTGRRGAARADYRRALDGPADPAVARAAALGLRRAYRRKQARQLNIEFAYADVISP